MGYVIWDRVEGGPATNKRYATRNGAVNACERMNGKNPEPRYYVKTL